MTVRFGVLGSGSSGNACFVSADGFGLLIDAGLGPRTLERILGDSDLSWDDVHAVILTHTHSDHCRHATLKHLARRGVPLYCHVRQQAALHGWSDAIACLEDADLVRNFELDACLSFGPMSCRPFTVPHDDTLTCGFRFDGAGWSIGYAADLGSWSRDIAARLADVDLLALEFNHDVEMQRSSGRTPWLISRNLGRFGHLSNVQAAGLLQAVLRQSAPGRLRHLVQLHLSEQCNTAELARGAAEELAGDSFCIHTADGARELPWITLTPTAPRAARVASVKTVQACFSWWTEELAG
jgi:phosphoribosyl 1,2-cyclic phosphodiesterase